jgi:hypothetical protein
MATGGIFVAGDNSLNIFQGGFQIGFLSLRKKLVKLILFKVANIL